MSNNVEQSAKHPSNRNFYGKRAGDWYANANTVQWSLLRAIRLYQSPVQVQWDWKYVEVYLNEISFSSTKETKKEKRNIWMHKHKKKNMNEDIKEENISKTMDKLKVVTNHFMMKHCWDNNWIGKTKWIKKFIK